MPLTYLRKQYQARQTRWTPTGDQFAFADSVNYLKPQDWDHVADGRALFSRTYLSCLEEHRPEQLTFMYGLIYRDAEPIAAVIMQILDTDLSVFAPKDSRRAKGGRFVNQRIFVCGSLLCWGNRGVAVAPGVDESSVWPSVAEALYRVRRSARLSGVTDFVLVRDLPAKHAQSAILEDYSYSTVDVEPDMVLDLRDWKCYDDYLASLQSKYRKAAKDIRKKLEKGGCVLEDLASPEQHEKRLSDLYRAVWQEAEVRPVEFSPKYLGALKRALGEDYAYLVIRRENEILGFVTLIKDGETAIGYILGFDREEAARGLPLYLRLLQAVVERSLEWGCKHVSFGGTALEPKARLGAQPSPRQVWARHRLAPLNVMVKPLLESFTPQQPPDRNPFKKS
jgi:GNAT acetyltransferase-like protein